jgi:hypothetical protein
MPNFYYLNNIRIKTEIVTIFILQKNIILLIKEGYNKYMQKLYLSNRTVLIKNRRKKIYYNSKGRAYILQKGGASSLEEEYMLLKDETALACFLQSDENIFKFAFEIMVKTINILINCKIKTEDIIKSLNETTKDDKGIIILKPGFTKDESKNIFNIIQSKNISDINNLLKDLIKKNKFHQIMGSFYNHTQNPLILKAILENDEELQQILIDRIKVMFCLPDDYNNWNEIKHYIDDDKNKFLYLEVFANGAKCPESLYRRNLVNSNSIRGEKNINAIEYKMADITECHMTVKNNNNSKIVTGNTWYNIDNTTFFAKLLSKFGRTYMAGPSGSAVLLYQFIFQFLKYKQDETNKFLLLACIIGDYIPYYHSLTEILMTYSFEIDKKYDLSIDPVKFVKDKIKPYLKFNLSRESSTEMVAGMRKHNRALPKRASSAAVVVGMRKHNRASS